MAPPAVKVPVVKAVAHPHHDKAPSPPPPPALSAPPPPPRARKDDSPTSPTAPGRKAAAPARVAPLPQGRVVLVFLGSFGLTMGLVLGTWFGVVRPARPVPVPPAPVVVMAPPPVVEPPPAPVVEEAVAEAEPVAVVEPPPAPKPAPVRRPAPRRPAPKPAPVPEVVAPADTPAATEEEIMAILEEPVAPPPPAVPEAAAAHDGWYNGKLQTKAMSLVLIFRPEGKLTGIITITDGDSTEEMETTGTWTLSSDGSATIALVDNSTATSRVWSGRVSGGEVDGRLVDDSRVPRRFHASR